MVKDFGVLSDKFQGNVYWGMVNHLGEKLGVTPDALDRLGLGFVPIVEFKKGKNFQGWWSFPERDDTGKVLGISLRSADGKKCMYPGSNHGLIYECAGGTAGKSNSYRPGPGNWIRSMDAGVCCPICGKPDGCLLSEECPSDPRAVVCIRNASEDKKRLRFGWLHIRKPEGDIRPVCALAGEGTVLVVEGASDTAAAIGLGLAAVGRPSNLACMDMLSDLLRGRTAIIIGENDRKPDGKEPGKEGMIATFQTLKRVCKGTRMVMPPATVKDLRAWVAKAGLTREGFLNYVKEFGQEEPDNQVLFDERPTTVARAYLTDNYRLAGRYSIKRWRNSWYRYTGVCYQHVEDEAFVQPMYPWGYNRLVQYETTKGTRLKPLVVNTTFCTNIGQAIGAEVLVTEPILPVWINGKDGPAVKDLIVFQNGILDGRKYAANVVEENCFLESTPDLFTVTALPSSFDTTAKCDVWLRFLDSSIGDDPAKIQLLQEWFGYCIVPDASHQKMMFLRGPTAAGKGTVIRVLCDMVGRDQYASTNFAELITPFGLAPLMNKLIAVIPDCRTPRQADMQRGLEILLNLTGEDGVQINRKFRDQIDSYQLFSRVTIASNEFLDVPDHAGALIRRLNIIQFQRSFAQNPDSGLTDRLREEIPGITMWALDGLRRLRATGKFTLPASSKEAISEWRVYTSPIASFLQECTEPHINGEIARGELYDAWVAWAAERRIGAMTTGRFFERIRANSPHVITASYEQGGHKHSVFRGLIMKPWAAKQFLGRPR